MQRETLSIFNHSLLAFTNTLLIYPSVGFSPPFGGATPSCVLPLHFLLQAWSWLCPQLMHVAQGEHCVIAKEDKCAFSPPGCNVGNVAVSFQHGTWGWSQCNSPLNVQECEITVWLGGR